METQGIKGAHYFKGIAMFFTGVGADNPLYTYAQAFPPLWLLRSGDMPVNKMNTGEFRKI